MEEPPPYGAERSGPAPGSGYPTNDLSSPWKRVEVATALLGKRYQTGDGQVRDAVLFPGSGQTKKTFMLPEEDTGGGFPSVRE